MSPKERTNKNRKEQILEAAAEALYLAVLDRAFGQIHHTFQTVDASPEQLKEAMGEAFVELLTHHRNEILLVMTSFAIPEPVIRDDVRNKFDKIYELIKSRFEQAGVPDAAMQANAFVGQGLTITLAETLKLQKLLPWNGEEDDYLPSARS